MSFYAKYEILALLRDDAATTGIKTFSARHLASGQTVGVHLLFENVPGQPAAILDRVRSLGPEKVSQVIEVGTHEGTSYVVTAQSSWPQSFDEWMGKPPAAAAPTKASADNYGKAGNWRVPTSEFALKSDPGASTTAATPIPEPGGFTRMFSISPRSAAGGEMSTSSALHPSAIRPLPTQAPFVPVTPPQAPPPAAPSAVSQQAFHPPTAPPQPAPPAPPSQIFPAAPTPGVDLSGETRKMEVAPVKPVTPPVAPPAPPPAAAGPGEFTRMFQVPSAAASTAPPVQAPPRQPEMSSTKTMPITGGPPVSAPPAAPSMPQPAPPPAASTPGEFTQMFQALPKQTTPSVIAPAATPPPAPPAPVLLAGPAPGEFTQMFQTTAPSPAPTPSAITPIVNRGTAPPAPAPAPPAAAAPGDFTNIFKTGVAPAQQAPPPAPPAAAAPGDFTNIFKTGAAPAQQPPPPPPPPAAGPGEFTRIFQASSVRPAGEAPPVQQQPPPASPSAGSAPGEFTKFFQTPVESPAPRPHPALNDPFGKSAPPPSGPQPGGPGEFTQMFGVPSRPTQGGTPEPYKPTYSPSFAQPPSSSATGAFSTPSSRPQQSPQMGSAPSGPGEYTQMFSTPSQPSAPAPPPAPAAAAKPNYLPLIIIFGVLFVVAVGLVIYFLMHR